jgi:hypothetical protein
MNVGLPGAGIGGLFYLICTVLMPFKEVFLTLTKPEHKFRYRLILTQLSIVSGIVGGIIIIYMLVSHLFGLDPSFPVSINNSSVLFYSLLPVLISLGLLLLILSLMRIVAFFSTPHKTPLDNSESVRK